MTFCFVGRCIFVVDMEHEVYMEASNYAYQPIYADLRWIMLEDRSLRLVWQINADFEDAWYVFVLKEGVHSLPF